MKAILSHKWFGIPVLVVAVGAAAILAAGGVLAATAFNFHGTATPVASGGSGGTGGTPLTYDFKVTTDPAGTIDVTDAFFDLGNVSRGAQFTKTVYITKTGTASSFDVTVSKSAGVGLVVTVPATVPLPNATPVAVNVVVNVEATATLGSPIGYDVAFNYP